MLFGTSFSFTPTFAQAKIDFMTCVDKMKGHVLFTSTNLWSSRCILDLGASHHMDSSLGMFSSYKPCTTPHILIGE